jgi:hypothetical protein
MLLQIYTVYDECTETYGVPFFMVNDKTAERAFFMLVNDSNSTVFKSPKDFSLYCIGSFDDSNPAVSTFVNPVFRHTKHYHMKVIGLLCLSYLSI